MNVACSNLVLDRPLAIIDLESTGFDPAQDRIVEIAVLSLLPGGCVEPHHWQVNPGRPIPAAATAIHGIADVATAPTFGAIAHALHQLLESCDLAGLSIAAFDLALLSAKFARAEVPFHVAGRAALDALTLYRRHEPRDLSAALRCYLGAERVGAHSAAAAAAAALAVLDTQIGRYGLPANPAALHSTFVDVAGRSRRDPEGRIVFAFGKHVGRLLDEVAGFDSGYLEWMLGRPFLDDVHALVRLALTRRDTP